MSREVSPFADPREYAEPEELVKPSAETVSKLDPETERRFAEAFERAERMQVEAQAVLKRGERMKAKGQKEISVGKGPYRETKLVQREQTLRESVEESATILKRAVQNRLSRWVLAAAMLAPLGVSKAMEAPTPATAHQEAGNPRMSEADREQALQDVSHAVAQRAYRDLVEMAEDPGGYLQPGGRPMLDSVVAHEVEAYGNALDLRFSSGDRDRITSLTTARLIEYLRNLPRPGAPPGHRLSLSTR